jgi:dienelactone hydrolase
VANTRRSRRLTYLLLLLVLVVLAGLVAWKLVDPYLRAMSVLTRFSDPQAHSFTTRFANHPFQEQMGSARTPHGPLVFRLYIPQGVTNPPAMLLLHGIHHLGIEEPRLVSFSKALAGAGIEVMTPELKDLADYRVTPETIDVIGDSAVVLGTRMKQPVGVMGLSFAGGLALMAAAMPEYAPKIGFVVAVGAHDDMARVAHFFIANKAEEPNGASEQLTAHEYGVLVLAYAHLDQFFSPADIPSAQEALRLWLWEKPQEAETASQRLSKKGKATFDELVQHRELAKSDLEAEIEKYRPEMEAVSPHGHLSQLKVPVYLLHGAGDTVIPAAETEWLARDVPRKELKAVLISPALIHVNMEEKVPFSQKWALVDFLARVMRAANGLQR